MSSTSRPIFEPDDLAMLDRVVPNGSADLTWHHWTEPVGAGISAAVFAFTHGNGE